MTIFNPDRIRDITIFSDIQRPDPALREALSRAGAANGARL